MYTGVTLSTKWQVVAIGSYKKGTIVTVIGVEYYTLSISTVSNV